jgi:hypothetical protein
VEKYKKYSNMERPDCLRLNTGNNLFFFFLQSFQEPRRKTKSVAYQYPLYFLILRAIHKSRVGIGTGTLQVTNGTTET